MINPVRPRLLITRAAKLDIKHAERWYDARSIRLGDRFLTAVDETVTRLLEFPASAPHVHPRIRRAVVEAFPYSVFYVYERSRIRVIAVMHWRRDPIHWLTRI